MSGLFEKWLFHYDPIHLGYTPRGIANGVTATCGWSFPRVSGGYNLYRGSPGVDAVDFDVPVGAAGASATTIRNFPGYGHAGETTYAYVIRAIGGGGVESAASAPAVEFAFDASGELIGPRPNTPTQVSVAPYASGAFLLRWTYSAIGQSVEPAEFQIFHDAGTGTVDLDTPQKTVPYRRGVVHYSAITSSFWPEAVRLWVVRAVSAEGVTDGNTNIVSGRAYRGSPPVHPTVVAAVGEEYY